MSKGSKLVVRVCEKCGVTQRVRSLQKRCRRQNFGPRSYWCYGWLRPVEQPSDPNHLRDAIRTMAAEGAVEQAIEKKQRPRPQDVAFVKLQRARKRVTERMRELAHVTRSLRQWEAKVRRLEREAAMTDEQVAARSERGKAANKARGSKRRGIRLTGGVE